MASDKFYRQAIKSSVASICQQLGWHSAQNAACDILTDVMVRHLKALGRTAADYTSHAERTNVGFPDIYQTFDTFNISLDELIQYYRCVDDGAGVCLPQSLPVEVVHKHVYQGMEQVMCRKRRHKSVEMKDGGGSAGEDEEEEEEEEEEWEVIPSHLPPLPQIVTNNQSNDDDGGENEIQLMEEDGGITPTSLTSPIAAGTIGLPVYSHLKESDMETNSRRSSISDEVNNAQAVSRFALVSSQSETIPSPVPTTPKSNTFVVKPSSPHQLPTAPSPIAPSPTTPSPILPSPTPPSPILPSPTLPSPTPPSPTPPSPILPSPQSPFPMKPPPTTRQAIKPNLTISIEPDLIKPAPVHLPQDLSQMPPLHLISPRTPVSPVCLPQLSSLHKTPPTSPFIIKPVRPVLHPIKPVVKQVSITGTTDAPASDVTTVKPLSITADTPVDVVSNKSKAESLQPSSKIISFSPVITKVEDVSSAAAETLTTSTFEPPNILTHPPTPSFESDVASKLSQNVSYKDKASTDVNIMSELLTVSPKRMSASPLSTSEASELSAEEEASLQEDTSSLPDDTHVISESQQLVIPTATLTRIESDLSVSSTSSSASSPGSVTKDEPVLTLPAEGDNVVLPPLLAPPIMPGPPYAGSFGYKTKSPLSIQEEEDDETSDSESSEFVDYSTPQNDDIMKSSLTIVDPLNVQPLNVQPPSITTIDSSAIRNGSPPDSLTVKINKSVIESSKQAQIKSPLAASLYKQTSSPALPPVGQSELIVSSSSYQQVDSINIPSSLNKFISSPPTSLIVKISQKYLASKEKTKSLFSDEGVKITIPTSILTGKLGSRKSKPRKKGKKKGNTARGVKREHGASDVGLKSKKMKYDDNSVSNDGSSSNSDEDDESNRDDNSIKMEVSSKRTSRSADDSSENKEGLKLRLKLPQIGVGRRQASSTSLSVPIPAASKRKSPKPSVQLGKSDSLVIKSSPPVKVPSIKVQQKAPPSIVVAKSSSEIYICPLCKRPDDGTPMICCDNCDVWLHMSCVGLTSNPPDNKKWFCPPCKKKSKKVKKR